MAYGIVIRIMMPPVLRAFLCASLFAGASTIQAAVLIQIIADNDFAIYAGTDTSITRSIYQNNVIWNSQLSAAESFSFELEEGETTFYLLAMGGSGEENISGKINGVNIVGIFQEDSSKVIQSNAIQGFLSSYDLGTVSNGTYTPTLSSVQGALAAATWGAPTVVTGVTVVSQNPHAEIGGVRSGFNVPASSAVFFRFDATSVNLPEPGTAMLLALGACGIVARRRRIR